MIRFICSRFFDDFNWNGTASSTSFLNEASILLKHLPKEDTHFFLESVVPILSYSTRWWWVNHGSKCIPSTPWSIIYIQIFPLLMIYDINSSVMKWFFGDRPLQERRSIGNKRSRIMQDQYGNVNMCVSGRQLRNRSCYDIDSSIVIRNLPSPGA